MYFYQATHGIKRISGKTLEEIQRQVECDTHFLLFVQTHFGATINAPDNCVALLKKKKKTLKQVFGTSDMFLPCNYNLMDYGYFHSLYESTIISERLVYAHSYPTFIQRRYDSDYPHMALCYALTNGYYGSFNGFTRLKKGNEQQINNYKTLVEGLKSQDLRIKVAEMFESLPFYDPV